MDLPGTKLVCSSKMILGRDFFKWLAKSLDNILYIILHKGMCRIMVCQKVAI